MPPKGYAPWTKADYKAQRQNARDFLDTIRDPSYLAVRWQNGEDLGTIARGYNNVDGAMIGQLLVKRFGINWKKRWPRPARTEGDPDEPSPKICRKQRLHQMNLIFKNTGSKETTLQVL